MHRPQKTQRHVEAIKPELHTKNSRNVWYAIAMATITTILIAGLLTVLWLLLN